MSVLEFRKELYEFIQDMLWKHWTALGIPGHVSATAEEIIIDPEALIIFSSRFARYDQRLYDLILEWMQLHSSQINIQRLKALNSKAEIKDTASLGYISAVVSEVSPARWKKPTTDYSSKTTEAVSLFMNMNDEPESFIPKHDTLALQHGFYRNVRNNTPKVPVPLPAGAATLQLRMRGLLGISARTETLLVLLTSKICKVQDIVERSGFIWKSIQEVLDELIAGGFVSYLSGCSRGKQYYLTEPEKIRKCLDAENVMFFNWLNIYDTLGLIWQSISNPRLSKLSDETINSMLTTLYENKLQRLLINSNAPSLKYAKLKEIIEIIRSVHKEGRL